MPEPHELAVTEEGRTLPHSTEDEVNCALKLLIYNGGDATRTVKTMKEYGYTTTRRQLEGWRDHSFRTRHYNMRREMANDVGEEIAGRALENAIQADEIQGQMLERLGQNISDLEAKDLPRGIQALAQAKSQDIEKAQLLRDKPTEIVERRDISEIYAELRQLNVVRVENEATEKPRNAIPGPSATEIPSESGTT